MNDEEKNTVSEGEEREVQLCPFGVFPQTRENGEREVQVCDAETFRKILENFDGAHEVLVDLDHESEKPQGSTQAAAWITAMRIDPQRGLMATLRYTDTAAAAFAAMRERSNTPAAYGHLFYSSDNLNKKRLDQKTDHRVHFGEMEDHPESKPLEVGDIELLPSMWRRPDRVAAAEDKGAIILEMDAADGADVYRLVVSYAKVSKDGVAAYKEVPLMLPLKSDVAVRKAQAVIAGMMEAKGIEKA